MMQLETALQTKWAGRKVFWQEEIDSTNVWAKKYARDFGSEEMQGALFLADKQTAGKGRFDRIWVSPSGENIYMTLVLWKPPIEPWKASQLTLVMGLSAAQAAKEISGVRAGIKWPNDVVMSGKKICGILTEMHMEKDKPEYIIIGVGINVNQKKFPVELCEKATSLYLECKRELDRISLVAKVMEHFEDHYERFLQTGDLSLLKEDYERILLNKDQQVRILEKGEESRGIARGITPLGELLIENTDGTMRKVFSGEVSVRGLYSYV